MKVSTVKILLLIVSLQLITFTSVIAAYFNHVPITVTQPNGKQIKLFVTGDEYYRRVYDANNYTVVVNPITGYYVYAELLNDVLVPGSQIVQQRSTPPAGILPGLDLSPRKKQEKREAYWANVPPKANLTDNPNPGVLTSGTVNNLVVFIRFSDQTEFTSPLTTFDNMFNNSTPGYNSMFNYYKEASFNTLSLPSTYYPLPSGTVIVSYQDTHPRAYYQVYNASTNPIGYQNSSQSTSREHTLLANAVTAIASQVPTALNIDNDNDGYVDNVCFLVRGGYDGWAALLWPHRWVLYSNTVYINGKRVYDYDFQLETFLSGSGAGVLCHEMFHSLGAPDLYHYTSNGIAPVGPWDLMENTSNPPESMGAWMKYKYGHWISSVPTITSTGTYTLNPVTSSSGNIYKLSAGGSSTEFFIFEYRQKTGTFENSVPGSGLLIYRINTAAGDGNASGPPDEVYIYRPNGTLTVNGTVSSAYFSSGSGRTSFNATTNPYPFYSSGAMAGINISNVTAAGSTISFTVGNAADFSANLTAICPSQTVVFSDASFGGPTSWSWSFSPASVTYVDGTSSTSQNPHVQFSNAGYYSVTLAVNGPGGSNSLTKTSFINVLSAVSPTFAEDFETGLFSTHGWSLDNPDGSTTWTIKSSVGGNSPGIKSAYVNFYSYSNRGQRDWLVSTPVNLTNYGTAQLTFKVAYRRYDATYHDSLKVMVYDNCGQTWLATPYEKTGTTLATGADLTSDFTPSLSSDWRTETISLNNYIGDVISIKFVACNDFGNNLYIDDIYISGNQLIPNFTASITTPCPDSAVNFTDQSSGGATAWLWDFGDGNTSTLQNPVHSYLNPGTYTVTLTISNGNSSNSLVKTNYIIVSPNTQVSITISSSPSGPVCPGTTVTFTATASGQGNSPIYQWKVNGINAGTNSTTFSLLPNTGDQVECILTSSATCPVY